MIPLDWFTGEQGREGLKSLYICSIICSTSQASRLAAISFLKSQNWDSLSQDYLYGEIPRSLLIGLYSDITSTQHYCDNINCDITSTQPTNEILIWLYIVKSQCKIYVINVCSLLIAVIIATDILFVPGTTVVAR